MSFHEEITSIDFTTSKNPDPEKALAKLDGNNKIREQEENFMNNIPQISALVERNNESFASFVAEKFMPLVKKYALVHEKQETTSVS